MNTERTGSKRPPREGGVALLESVTALFIAVVGLMGVLQMLDYGVDKIRTIEEFAVAGRVLQNELETLRAHPFDALESANHRDFVSASPELSSLPDAEVFSVVRSSQTLPARVKEITVVVAWTTEHGRRVDRRLTTLVARKDAP